MTAQKKPFSFPHRFTALGVLICVLFTGLDSPAAYAAPVEAAASEKISSPLQLSVPENLGSIQETFAGKKSQTVIMIQDAHGIPEAQRNIQKLIGYFQKKGVRNVALEGAASRLDPQFLKSFPDPKALRTLMEDCLEKGELTGVNAAALFASQGIFQGVEDWKLYEKGTGYYLAALEKEGALLKKVERKQIVLRQKKEKVYSEELLMLDRLLERFEENQETLSETLQKLASIERPEKGSSLSLLLEEIESEKGHWGKEESKRAQKQKQIQKRFFPEFEAYAKAVKEKLFRSKEEKKLDARSRYLRLVKKMVRLELTKREWEEIKAFSGTLSVQHAFYETAEKRDAVFFQKIRKMLAKQSAVLFVGGGFHSENLTGWFRRAGISYVLVTPQMSGEALTKTRYREHMRGDVSWKSYFKAEDGKINLYDAFARAARDRLLKVTGDMSRVTRQASLLKLWRDQIIRDLAARGKVEKARQSTRFLDEIHKESPQVRASSPFLKKWYANAGRFIGGLRELESSGRFTQQNILKLLQRPATVEWALSFEPQKSFDTRFLHFLPRSEMREEPLVFETNTKGKIKTFLPMGQADFDSLQEWDEVSLAGKRSEVRSKAYETYEEALPEAEHRLAQVIQQLRNQEIEWPGGRFGNVKVKMEANEISSDVWEILIRAVGDWKYEAGNLREELAAVESEKNVVGMTKGAEAKGLLGQIILNARVIKEGERYVPVVLVEEIQGATGVKKGERRLNFRRPVLKEIREAADAAGSILAAHTPRQFAGRIKPEEVIKINYLFPFEKKESGKHRSFWLMKNFEMAYEGDFYRTPLWLYESKFLPSFLEGYGLKKIGVARSEMRLDVLPPNEWLAETIRQSEARDRRMETLKSRNSLESLLEVEKLLGQEKDFLEKVERRLTDDHSALDTLHERAKDRIFALPFGKKINLIMISLPLVALNGLSKKYWPGFADYFKDSLHEKLVWKYGLEAASHGTRIEILNYQPAKAQVQLFQILREVQSEMEEEFRHLRLHSSQTLEEFSRDFGAAVGRISISHIPISFRKPPARSPLPDPSDMIAYQREEAQFKLREISQEEFEKMTQRARRRYVAESIKARIRLREKWRGAASYWLGQMRDGSGKKNRRDARAKANFFIERMLYDALARLYERGEVLEKATGKIEAEIRGLIKARVKGKKNVLPILDQKMVQDLIRRIRKKPSLSRLYEMILEGRRGVPPIFEYKGDGAPPLAGMPRRWHLISHLRRLLKKMEREFKALQVQKTKTSLERFKKTYGEYQKVRDETLVLAYRDPRLKEYYKRRWISEIAIADSKGMLGRLKKRLLSYSETPGDSFQQLAGLIHPGLIPYKRPIGDEVWFALRQGANEYGVLFSELNFGRGYFLHNPPDEEDSVYHKIFLGYLEEIQKQRQQKTDWRESLEAFDRVIRKNAPQIYPTKVKVKGERMDGFVRPEDASGYPTYARDRRGRFWKLHPVDGKVWEPARRVPANLKPFVTSLSSARSYENLLAGAAEIGIISDKLESLADVQKQNPRFIHKVMSSSNLVSAKVSGAARSEVRSLLGDRLAAREEVVRKILSQKKPDGNKWTLHDLSFETGQNESAITGSERIWKRIKEKLDLTLAKDRYLTVREIQESQQRAMNDYLLGIEGSKEEEDWKNPEMVAKHLGVDPAHLLAETVRLGGTLESFFQPALFAPVRSEVQEANQTPDNSRSEARSNRITVNKAEAKEAGKMLPGGGYSYRSVLAVLRKVFPQGFKDLEGLEIGITADADSLFNHLKLQGAKMYGIGHEAPRKKNVYTGDALKILKKRKWPLDFVYSYRTVTETASLANTPSHLIQIYQEIFRNLKEGGIVLTVLDPMELEPALLEALEPMGFERLPAPDVEETIGKTYLLLRKPRSPRSEVRSQDSKMTGSELLTVIRSKYGSRHLLQGGPLKQPDWFTGFKIDETLWTELKEKGFDNLSYRGLPGDPADLRSFAEVAEEIEAGKIALPLIYKPNLSSDGRKIFFLERNPAGRFVLTTNRITSFSEKHFNSEALLGYLDASPFVEEVIEKPEGRLVSYVLKENIPFRKFLTEVWRLSSIPSTGVYDSGMMEAVYQNALKPHGRAFETRYAFEGAFGADISFVPSSLDSYEGGLETFSRSGASSYLGNYAGRPGAEMRVGSDLYEPLFSIYPELRNRKEEFEGYVQNLLRQQWVYLNKKISTLGVRVDFQVRGYFDLMWLPPDESSQGFPVPALVEMHLIPEDYRELNREILLRLPETRSRLAEAEQFFKNYTESIYYPASYTDWDSLRRLAKIFPKVSQFVYVSDTPLGVMEFDEQFKEAADLKDYRLQTISNDELLIHLTFKDGPEAEEWLRGRKFTVRYLIRDFRNFSEKAGVVFVQTPGIGGKLSKDPFFWDAIGNQGPRYFLVSRKETSVPLPEQAELIGEIPVEAELPGPMTFGVYQNLLPHRSEARTAEKIEGREMNSVGAMLAQALRPGAAAPLDEETIAGKVEAVGRGIGVDGLARLIHRSIESEILALWEGNGKAAREGLDKIPSAGTRGSAVAIALNQDGSVAGLPMMIPAETLARALRNAAPFLKKVYYVTDYEVPQSLRNIGVPAKRIFDGQPISGEKSIILIGKTRLVNPNLLEMNIRAEGEIDPQAAQLLLDMMLKAGALLSENENRVKGDLIKKLLEVPALRWILDPALAQFRIEGDRAILTFAASVLQEKLSAEKFSASA